MIKPFAGAELPANDLLPSDNIFSMSEILNLLRPIYKKTAAYGHFGRNDPDFTWERTDKVEELKKSAGI